MTATDVDLRQRVADLERENARLRHGLRTIKTIAEKNRRTFVTTDATPPENAAVVKICDVVDAEIMLADDAWDHMQAEAG